MATEAKGYNGWTNYQTWNIALWFGNDQGLYLLAREVTREILRDFSGDEANNKLADWIRTYVQNLNPLRTQSSLYADLLNSAISETNWYEIAKAWIEDFTGTDNQKSQT